MDPRTVKSNVPGLSPTLIKWLVAIVVIGTGMVGAIVFRNQWLPKAIALWASVTASTGETDAASAGDDHAGHAHAGDNQAAHAGHDEGNSLELSPQARKNIDLQTAAIVLQPFMRTLSMPAMVVGRPGRSQVEVTAPLGGRVTRVYPIEGDAVEPGQPLFDLRLTHEELVQAQSELLRLAEQLDVELLEIRRLEMIAQSGAIPGRRLLERQYEKQKVEASLNARQQSLLLHGLTQQQVEDIVQKRKLLQDVTVMTPEYPKNGYVVPPHASVYRPNTACPSGAICRCGRDALPVDGLFRVVHPGSRL
jgi:multidrug efflux pump subunit AcrA (membrane-fusion protein)